MSFRWISLIAFVLVASVVWIIVGLTQRSSPEYLREKYRNELIPLSAELDEKALDEILKRESETMLIGRDSLE